MKYIKTSILIIIVSIFFYYQLNKDSNRSFEDKLSMFILIKDHKNIDDIFVDLSRQIESFDETIYNVYFSRNNHFLIKNKLKSQFDIDYINYKYLLSSSDIIDFNLKIGEMIEDYFLNHQSSFHLTKEYLLRDFLVRFHQYVKHQISLFEMKNNFFDSPTLIEDFILGPKYISDYKMEYYVMRVEFIDLNSIINYESSGMDSIFQSILDYNSKVFDSELILYNPYDGELLENKLSYDLKQYVKEFDFIEDAINYHKNLMLSDNVILIESIYDYYFSSINSIPKDKSIELLKVHSSILDTNFQINQSDYKKSLFLIEEKLIALQSDDLSNDKVITNILYDLIGDGDTQGLYSQYIDLISLESDYLIDNLNRLFSEELKSLFGSVDQAENEFDIFEIPNKINKHLAPSNKFKVRYFVE